MENKEKNMKLAMFAMLVTLMAVGCWAQNAPIPTQTFSFSASAIALPGGRGTFAGTDAGVSFNPTQNLSIAQHSILSADGGADYFGGGVDYALPQISLKANNVMPIVSGFRMLFSVGGSMGVARVKNASGTTLQHYGADFHGAFNYALSSTGAWQLGVRGGAMRLPYYERGWTKFFELGPSFHF
jgi:hypothetical protein